MIAWGRANDIQAKVANVPDKWLGKFAIHHPGDIRKFGASRNATLLYRSAAVIEAVEAGETYAEDESGAEAPHFDREAPHFDREAPHFDIARARRHDHGL